jgi:hypothetical protein
MCVLATCLRFREIDNSRADYFDNLLDDPADLFTDDEDASGDDVWAEVAERAADGKIVELEGDTDESESENEEPVTTKRKRDAGDATKQNLKKIKESASDALDQLYAKSKAAASVVPPKKKVEKKEAPPKGPQQQMRKKGVVVRVPCATSRCLSLHSVSPLFSFIPSTPVLERYPSARWLTHCGGHP